MSRNEFELTPSHKPQRARDPNDSTPISSFSPVRVVKATRLIDADGALVFGPDVSLTAHLEQRELNSSEGRQTWFRHEFKTVRVPIGAGHWLTLAGWPYSGGWTYKTKFKQAWKRAMRDKPRPDGVAFTQEALATWVEDQTFDYWETNPEYVTAGFSKPFRAAMVEPARNEKARVQMLCATCKHWEKARAVLADSREVQAMRAKTRNRTIRFVPRWNKQGKPTTRDGSGLYLHPDMVAEAEQYLDIAIDQALAGPNTPSDVSERWVGVSVGVLVLKIYRGHLQNIYKRHKKRNPRIFSTGEVDSLIPESVDALDHSDVFEEMERDDPFDDYEGYDNEMYWPSADE